MIFDIRPTGDINKAAKALIFDSWFDKFRGAGCSIALLDGKLQKGGWLVISSKNEI